MPSYCSPPRGTLQAGILFTALFTVGKKVVGAERADFSSFLLTIPCQVGDTESLLGGAAFLTVQVACLRIEIIFLRFCCHERGNFDN